MAHAVSPETGRHLVQFYDDAGFLAERVAAFLQPALARSGAALVVARSHNLISIEQELRDAGLSVERLRLTGQLVLLDAADVLARFMVDGQPDRALFREHVGGQIARMRAAFPSDELRIYGEMVDVLWVDQNASAVIALERLWTELSGVASFSLLCGYQLGGFSDERHVRQFEMVCAAHDHVAPTEQVAMMGSDSASSRSLALLEQRARSLETEVSRRNRSERRMEQLLAVAGELAAAGSRDAIARITIDSGMAAVGASSAALWTVDEDRQTLRLLAVSKQDWNCERFSDLPVTNDTPLGKVVRSGTPIFFGTLDEYKAAFPASFARVADTVSSSDIAYAMLPLATNHSAFGAICFTYDRGAEFSVTDRMFLEILSRQCALAIERVSLLEAERSGREAAELLYELTVQVNRTDDVDQVYELALVACERGSKTDRSAILLFDASGVMRFKCHHGLSETYRQAVEGHSPWNRDETNPTPISIDDVEQDPAWASYLPVFRAEGIRGVAFIPLVHQRRLLGKFMLYRDQPRPFTARDLQLTSTVAVHVGQAIERKRAEKELARAYREERDAHLEAEEATRAREEILSVVSHDLRNPLGTIMMGASSLLALDTIDKVRTRTISERIHRQAERMERLIGDLVDFAGIQAGKLAIERSTHAPAAILSAAGELFAPMASERGLSFQTQSAPGLPAVQCDSERAVQVLSNLLSNAIKVTPKGGAIEIGAQPSDQQVVFYVRDTGPGIDADELPNLFERFWRSKKPSYKGAGLGLSIARGIVDAHGGRIWAESKPGVGSTFFFSFSSSTRDN
ncbi:MAG: Two-component hybrid sensor and regulator [Myxococcales bacterium]|nr:Two-component hybrid sensor and regulator [Myxococcales bacterium]